MPRSSVSNSLRVAAILLIVVVGCSGTNKITVKGTVSHKGQRLSSGLLQFIGPEGAYSASAIQADGSYIMTDVVPGEVKVGVMSTPQGSGSSSSNKNATDPVAAPVSLPEKYRHAETSGVKYTIAPDTKELQIDLP